VGADGFFFAGTGSDFNEKFFTGSLGFIAKTSESGIGTSNCITTSFSDSGQNSVSYTSMTFSADIVISSSDDNWSIFSTNYSPSFTNLDFSHFTPVC